jgi:hypothetical protein
MGAVVRSMLADAGIEDYGESISYHLDGTVTVTLTDAEFEALQESTDVILYAGPGNSGAVRISTPETDAYFENNSPVLTDAERAERERKSGGGRIVNREEADRRKAALEARKQRLARLHGVDLDSEASDS